MVGRADTPLFSAARTVDAGRKGLADRAETRYSALMSDFVRTITTGTKTMTVISATMTEITTIRPAGRRMGG